MNKRFFYQSKTIIMDLIHDSWPWYIGGITISIIMFLLIFSGKEFGFSDNLRTIVSLLGGGKFSAFLAIDWKQRLWNLTFMLGTFLGGWIAATYMQSDEPMQLSSSFLETLNSWGLSTNLSPGELLPESLFNFGEVGTVIGFSAIILGGFFVGFGARYAGGCTSGHAISGLSNLQLPSLIAVIGFFIGGLFISNIIYPWLLNL